jgi:hypothetical protein
MVVRWMATYKFDDTVEMLETTRLEYAWIHVIFKVAVIERKADAVET